MDYPLLSELLDELEAGTLEKPENEEDAWVRAYPTRGHQESGEKYVWTFPYKHLPLILETRQKEQRFMLWGK